MAKGEAAMTRISSATGALPFFPLRPPRVGVPLPAESAPLLDPALWPGAGALAAGWAPWGVDRTCAAWGLPDSAPASGKAEKSGLFCGLTLGWKAGTIRTAAAALMAPSAASPADVPRFCSSVKSKRRPPARVVRPPSALERPTLAVGEAMPLDPLSPKASSMSSTLATAYTASLSRTALRSCSSSASWPGLRREGSKLPTPTTLMSVTSLVCVVGAARPSLRALRWAARSRIRSFFSNSGSLYATDPPGVSWSEPGVPGMAGACVPGLCVSSVGGNAGPTVGEA
mmetsp:Transcript_4429/g.18816  ORF Transcript_4429/g.18816 Transcript_4429/m.18816 type:complete len:285 (-) Transcript_4429:78-932(-)